MSFLLSVKGSLGEKVGRLLLEIMESFTYLYRYSSPIQCIIVTLVCWNNTAVWKEKKLASDFDQGENESVLGC